MPIRINLLAEAQAAEESRRRDPVKRVVIAGLLVLAGMAVWSSTVQLKVMLANRELGQIQFQMDSHKNDYGTAMTNASKIAAVKIRISKLRQMSKCRMLQGNLLNALQKVSVDNVRLTGIKEAQDYDYLPPAKGRNGVITSPASVTEHITVTLFASDSSPNPGDQVGKFMDALSRQSYFHQMLRATNGIVLTSESSPQQDPSGRGFVSFSVDCHYPDQKR